MPSFTSDTQAEIGENYDSANSVVFKIFFLEIIGQTLKFACMKKIFLFLSLMPLLAACGHKDASMTEGFDCVVYEPVHASGFNIK